MNCCRVNGMGALMICHRSLHGGCSERVAFLEENEETYSSEVVTSTTVLAMSEKTA